MTRKKARFVTVAMLVTAILLTVNVGLRIGVGYYAWLGCDWLLWVNVLTMVLSWVTVVLQWKNNGRGCRKAQNPTER